MMNTKNTIALLISFLLLINIAQAETYSLEPCGNTIISERGQDQNEEWVLSNNCFEIGMRKIYHPNVAFYDKINNEFFWFHLLGVEERDINSNEKNTKPFDQMNLVSTATGNTIYYSNANIEIGYTLDKNKIKTIYTANTYPYQQYTNSEYWLEIKYDPLVAGKLTWLPSISDGVTQPIIITNVTEGEDTTYQQYLGTGNQIILDPIYQVDYSPMPAQLLFNGTALQNENELDIIDITIGISDDNDTTQYETYEGEINNNIIQDYTDGTFESNDYLAITGDKLGVDFPLGQDTILDIEICVRGGYSKSGAKANLSINDTITGYQFNFPPTSNPTTYTCIKPNPNILLTGTNRIGVACVTCSAPTGYTYVSTDTTNPDNTSYTDYTGSWLLKTNLDWAIKIKYNQTNTSKAQTISGDWNKTYDSLFDWYLLIKKTSTENDPTKITIHPYLNTTSINQTYKVEQNLTGTGWYNINISNLMKYQKNDVGLNHTKIRFYTELPTNFSEIRLRKQTEDTTPPKIHECWATNNTIGCNGTAKWYCNITDEVDISHVTFTINNNNQTATSENGYWYYETTFNDNQTINETLTLTDVYAYDLVNNLNHTTKNIIINHYCEYCMPNWIRVDGSCQITDTFYRYYYDNNTCNTSTGMPSDNNTYQPCDYCYEDLQATYGTCTTNGTQTIDYVDWNYPTCCAITSIISDCSILYYPYNTTTYQSCTYFDNDFNCTYDTEPILNNKINVVCEMPNNQTYCCVINIYQGTNLLATTPEYKDATNTFLSLKSEEETRECFTPNHRLLNAYYTKKELRPETQFIIQVICTTNSGTTIRSEGFINPVYHEYDWLPHRLVSIGDKPVLTILTIVAIILLFLLAVWGIQKIRGR